VPVRFQSRIISRSSEVGVQSEGMPRYRYEATIKVILAADSQDEAYRMQQQIANDVVRPHTNERVVQVTASMLDLRHRPDLDGSLRNAG
jgi:hypothetical protein